MQNDITKYLENAKLLYEVAKYEYESEINRTSKLDEKVNKILTFESLIIVAFTALVTNSNIIDLLKAKYSFNIILSYSLVGMFIITISISLYILIQCLALRNIKKLHVSQEMSMKVGVLDNVSAYIEVVKNYSDITINNQKSNDIKAEKLFKNHNLLFISLFIIVLYVCSLFIAMLSSDRPQNTLTNINKSNNLALNLFYLKIMEEKMTAEKETQGGETQPSNNTQPTNIDPSSLFSFDNKQSHTTTVTLEDFTGKTGNLLLERKR
ncbi:hypothetical protein R4527_01870 [Acinetobacter baumannii]|nr:hypothetical protein [Acinetobacter baumannii]